MNQPPLNTNPSLRNQSVLKLALRHNRSFPRRVASGPKINRLKFEIVVKSGGTFFEMVPSTISSPIVHRELEIVDPELVTGLASVPPNIFPDISEKKQRRKMVIPPITTTFWDDEIIEEVSVATTASSSEASSSTSGTPQITPASSEVELRPELTPSGLRVRNQNLDAQHDTIPNMARFEDFFNPRISSNLYRRPSQLPNFSTVSDVTLPTIIIRAPTMKVPSTRKRVIGSSVISNPFTSQDDDLSDSPSPSDPIRFGRALSSALKMYLNHLVDISEGIKIGHCWNSEESEESEE